MKQDHRGSGRLGPWRTGLAIFVGVLTLWMAWRLGGAAKGPFDLRPSAPSSAARPMPNPQPPPLPLPTSPQPG